ncbi:glycosyltransferase [Selenomonas sp. WCA-380-WT-3B 3/]|uniref:Glycosyltransferase n=1 Tax=Selenomonas montiformis TaxID=2652285 RepID=A0A6I2V0N5_9FIRM|nr:glycosyltransferase family 2 protein [Selenomonas montiformis]MSV25032.1 glycosyltransferase [Selenomonas montiformis]
MDELISIVVPIYNGERYLAECLDSIQAQDYRRIEIILVDDGSTDGTAEICQRYVADDQRFRYIYQENGGQNAARKTGVEHAVGDWVMFVDADDFVTADYCSSFLNLQHETGADVIFGICQRYQDGKYGRKSKLLSGVLSGEKVLENIILPRPFETNFSGALFSVLYQKNIIQNALMAVDLRIRFAEDWACTIYSLRQAQQVAFLPKVVYFYRLAESSCCHTHTKSVVLDQKILRYFLLHTIAGLKNELVIRHQINWLVVNNLLLGGYEYFSDFLGLYPFGEIASGKRVVIYGAGVFGEELHDKFPQSLVLAGWVDRQATYYQSLGKPVSPVEDLQEMAFDYLVIAVMNPDTAEEIARQLQEKRIPAEKILRIDERWIDSAYTEQKLQELENVDENYRYVPAAISSSQGK